MRWISIASYMAISKLPHLHIDPVDPGDDYRSSSDDSSLVPILAYLGPPRRKAKLLHLYREL